MFDNFGTMVDCLTPQMLGYNDKEEVILRLNRAYPPDLQKNFNVMAIFIQNITPTKIMTREPYYER